MKHRKNPDFIGQLDLKLTNKELKIIKKRRLNPVLNKYNNYDICVKVFDTPQTFRTRNNATIYNFSTIHLELRKQKGWKNYDDCKANKKFNDFGYDVFLHTDGEIRQYRCRTRKPFVIDNPYFYDGNLDDLLTQFDNIYNYMRKEYLRIGGTNNE